MVEFSPVIDDGHLQRLGLMVTRWALLEECMRKCIGLMLRADPALVSILTTKAAGPTLTAWLLITAEQRFGPDIPALRECFTQIDKVRGERNSLVHGLWVTETPPGAVTVQTQDWNRGVVLQTEVVTLADLDDLNSEIHYLTGILVDLERQLSIRV